MSEQVDETVIILSQPQEAVLSSRQDRILEMAGQGSGKSENIGYSSGMFISDFPQLRGFIAANTSDQLSQSTLAAVFKTWEKAYDFTKFDQKANPSGCYVVDRMPPPHFKRFVTLRSYNSTITFWNGTLIFIGSLENYVAHDGKEFAWAHLDETKDTKEDAITEVIEGRLRQGGLWFDQNKQLYYNPFMTAEQAVAKGMTAWNPLYIHTSPAKGGVPWLNKMFELQKYEKEIKRRITKKEHDFFYKEFDNKAVCIYSAYHNQENLPPNYIPNQMAGQDEDGILRKVFGYPFGKIGNAWFHKFSRGRTVRKLKFNPSLPVSQTWDFNWIPYMTTLMVQMDYETRYLDEAGRKHFEPGVGLKPLEVLVFYIFREYCFENPRNSTEEICYQIKEDFDPAITEMDYFGDASGNSHIPGLGAVTNYKIIETELAEFFHNGSKKVKTVNIGVYKRRDLMNKILGGLIPEIELYIDEDCEKTIDDMENVKEGVKGKAKETDPKTHAQIYGHTSDALEYLVSEVCRQYLTE